MDLSLGCLASATCSRSFNNWCDAMDVPNSRRAWRPRFRLRRLARSAPGGRCLPRLPNGEAVTVVAATAVAGAALGRLLPRSWGAFAGPLVLGIAASVLVAAGIPNGVAAGWWIGHCRRDPCESGRARAGATAG